MNHQWLIYTKLLLTALFWGGTFTAGKIASERIGPFSISFLRFVIASLFLLFITWKIEGKLPRLKGRQIVPILLLGMTGIFIYNVCFFKGLQIIEAGRASLIISTSPVFIAVFSSWLFRERLNLIRISGIVISVMGAIIVISKGKLLGVFQGTLGWGELCIFCCVLCWVAYSLIGKAVMDGLSPIASVAYSSVVGTVALLIPACYEGIAQNITGYWAIDWLSIFYLGVFGTVIGFVWYYQAVKQIGPTRAGLFINFVPIFAIAIAFVMLEEKITLSLFAGAVLVIAGVYLTNKTS